MASRSCQRAFVAVLKVYCFLLVVFLSASYSWRFLEERREAAQDARLEHWLQPLRAQFHKQMVYYHAEQHRGSGNGPFEDKSKVVTAEDVLNTVDFDHPTELTSRVSTDVPFLHNARVSMEGPVRILSWSIRNFQQPGPWFSEGIEPFEKCELEPWMQCEYTHDRNMLNLSEALLFHPQHIFDLPPYRLWNQKWVFWELDSPQVTWEENPHLERLDNVFNLTSTYDLDSIVPIPFVRTCTANQVKSPKAINYAKGKERGVAWLSFTCQTPSKREAFVQELQKHIPVDVYGFCGNMSCNKLKPDQCMHKILQKKYKFFLTMEDSFCSNVPRSQSLWKIFARKLRMVPVVLGAANYTDLFPNHAFIDARSFTTVKHLALYLQYLDKNDLEYNKYFVNRDRPVCGFITNYSRYLCQLCRHLHNHRRQREYAPAVSEFWDPTRLCVKSDVFFGHYFKGETHSAAWWTQDNPDLMNAS